MYKKLLTALFILPLISQAQTPANKVKAKTTPPAAPAISTMTDSASYGLGLSIARDLKSRGVSTLNYSLLAKAFKDSFTGTKTDLTEAEAQKSIARLLNAMNEKKHEKSRTENTDFLKANKLKEGVVTLPSGLQYLVLRDGTGPRPKASDEVTVHYKGTLINGEEFDSSYQRNAPATFGLSQVIPGWTEGLQLMPTGSKYRFFIPWQLAYGPQGSGKIPPYSVLIFDVELIRIGK